MPMESEIQPCPGTQVLFDHIPSKDVKLVHSAPCTSSQPYYTTQDCQSETDELSQEQKILKSRMYHDILDLLLFAYYRSHQKK